MDKRAHRILAGLMIVYGSGVVVYIGWSLVKIRTDYLKELTTDHKAEQIVLRKINAGEYHGKTRDDVIADYEFWRMAVREEPSIS